jgi:hypothetical protein
MRKIMNRGRLAAIASGFAAATLGLGLWVSASAGAATTHAAAATNAPRYVVLNCNENDKAQVEPGTISLACADDGIGLSHLHWTSWTPELASAYGTEWQNDCKPDCADGHFHNYPVVVELWGSAAVKGHPADRRYTEATVSYPQNRPPFYVLNSSGKVVTTYPLSQTLPLGL